MARRRLPSVTDPGSDPAGAESETDEARIAEKGGRTPNRQGYRAGFYGRTLVRRVGTL